MKNLKKAKKLGKKVQKEKNVIENSLKKAQKKSMGLLEKQIVKTNITNPIVTFKVSVELYNKVNLVFNPNATQLKNKLSVTLSAMTDVFEDFERMDDIIRRRLVEVAKIKIQEESELKQQKKRQQPKKKN